jgi:hypothetical protein
MVDCAGGRVFDQATRACVCRAGTTEENGACVSNPRNACAPGQIQVSEKCLKPDPACTNGGTRLIPGGACVCPSGMVEMRGQCTVIVPRGGDPATCSPGQIRNIVTGRCECPMGYRATPQGCVRGGDGSGGDYTIPVQPDPNTCPGDMRRQADGSCSCPAGSGIKADSSIGSHTERVAKGACEVCSADQIITGDGYCGWPCPPRSTEQCFQTRDDRDQTIPGGTACHCSPPDPCPPGMVITSIGLCASVLPGSLPACPLGQVRHFGQCCTPESIAAGTCGGPSSTDCPPGFFRGTDGRCYGRPGDIVIPVCPPGLTLGRDGRCRPGGGVIITDPVRCGPNQVRGPDGRCHDRPTACPRGLVWDGQRCTRPGGGTPSCKKGLVWDGTKCTRPGGGTKPVCTGGLVWDGKRCAKPPSTKPQCGAGLRWDGRRCVPPPKTTKPKPKPGIRQPPPATIKNPGIRPTLPGAGSPSIRTPVTPVKPPQRPR